VTLRIANIRSWTPERVGTAASDIHDCIQRVVAEFPDELTTKWLIDELRADRQQLWVAYDEADPGKVVAIAFSEIRHYLATGHTFLLTTGMAGERVHETLPLLDVIEQWGWDRGAQSSEVRGRDGWTRLLKGNGYRRKSTTLKKAL
jgi:hypothetical protein